MYSCAWTNKATHQNIILCFLLAFDLFDLGSAFFHEAGGPRGLRRVHHRSSSRVGHPQPIHFLVENRLILLISLLSKVFTEEKTSAVKLQH